MTEEKTGHYEMVPERGVNGGGKCDVCEISTVEIYRFAALPGTMMISKDSRTKKKGGRCNAMILSDVDECEELCQYPPCSFLIL